MTDVIIVKAMFDEDAGVWLTESSDIHGLRIEAATLEALMARIPGAIEDLLADAPSSGVLRDTPVEVIAHASTRVRLPVAA